MTSFEGPIEMLGVDAYAKPCVWFLCNNKTSSLMITCSFCKRVSSCFSLNFLHGKSFKFRLIHRSCNIENILLLHSDQSHLLRGYGAKEWGVIFLNNNKFNTVLFLIFGVLQLDLCYAHYFQTSLGGSS